MRNQDLKQAIQSGDIWYERYRSKEFNWGILAFLLLGTLFCILLSILIVRSQQQRAEVSEAVRLMEEQSKLRDRRIEALLEKEVALETRRLNCIFNLRALQEADRLKSRPLKHYAPLFPDIDFPKGGASAPPSFQPVGGSE
jgi:hypothetical protein